MSSKSAIFLSQALTLLVLTPLPAQIVISGNENKIDLDPGAATVVRDPQPDSISILDFSEFPPSVVHLSDISNTVIGPPSNIAIRPDGRLALIADSLRIDPLDPTNTVPNNLIHVIDLTRRPPLVLDHITVGQQPSGMSFSPDGRMALVANRADGSVSVVSIDGKTARETSRVTVGESADSASDVAISPDGTTALVSLQNKSVLVELAIQAGTAAVTGRKFSVFGKPYRVVITPDGRFGITAGAGFGAPNDRDAVSIVDLKADSPHTVQHLTTGSSPESLEISPDGSLLAVVTMDGSNLTTTDPLRTQNGGLYLYQRTRHGFDFSQRLPTGRIPEGVAFTSDGQYLIVQCHPDRELRLYRVRGNKVSDTGKRVKVPGMPSSLRAAM